MKRPWWVRGGVIAALALALMLLPVALRAAPADDPSSRLRDARITRVVREALTVPGVRDVNNDLGVAPASGRRGGA
ncbi:MAG TPA: hypothetical protein VMS88_00985 [Terriglobales bacterium]|nr:hypothetical protein [Terriglobales bacterium]